MGLGIFSGFGSKSPDFLQVRRRKDAGAVTRLPTSGSGYDGWQYAPGEVRVAEYDGIDHADERADDVREVRGDWPM